MELLKVLNEDLRSPFKDFQYEIGKEYICTDFDTDPMINCSRGFYATNWDGLSYSYRVGTRVFECSVGGQKVEIDPFKRRYEKITLLREMPLSEIKQSLKEAGITTGYDLYHISFPVNPLFGESKEPTDADKSNLQLWDFVGDSVRSYVGNTPFDLEVITVWESIMDSVGYSIKDSVWESIMDSVRYPIRDPSDFIWNYVSSLLPRFKGNTCRPAIDLWHNGFVPTFDSKTWRLHSGKDANIVYEM